MNVKGWARISQTNVVVLCSFTAHKKIIIRKKLNLAAVLKIFAAEMEERK
jgi:hypothetical protein